MAKVKIRRGTTYRWVLRWASRDWAYAPVVDYQLTAPLRLIATAHGVPDGWPIVVFNANGSAAELTPKNTPPRQGDFRRAKVIDPNTIELNGILANLWKKPPPGAIIGYNPPIDLTGCTVRMQARRGVNGPVELEANSVLGNVEVNVAGGHTVLVFSDTVTAVPKPGTLVADVELVLPNGTVRASQPFDIEVVEEVTRG